VAPDVTTELVFFAVDAVPALAVTAATPIVGSGRARGTEQQRRAKRAR
jgi:hypothetical protein